MKKQTLECAWQAIYKGPLSKEEVLIIAPTIEQAVEKALAYQRSYTVIDTWQADTVI